MQQSLHDGKRQTPRKEVHLSAIFMAADTSAMLKADGSMLQRDC